MTNIDPGSVHDPRVRRVLRRDNLIGSTVCCLILLGFALLVIWQGLNT